MMNPMDTSEISVDMEVHMEVKSEPDIDSEYNCNESISCPTDDDLSMQEHEIKSDKDIEELEDEPLVEIDSITVPQQLVEVDLQPSLLLFVNADPQKYVKTTKGLRKCNGNTLSLVKESSSNRIAEEELAIRKSITRALRNVKRKQYNPEVRSCKRVIADEDKKISEDEGTCVSPCHSSCDADEEGNWAQSGKRKSNGYCKSITKKLKSSQIYNKTKKERRKKGINKIVSHETESNLNNSERALKIKRLKIKKSVCKKNDKRKNLQGMEINLYNIDARDEEPEFRKECLTSNQESREETENKSIKLECFDCILCSKKFTELSALVSHSKTHLDVKPESFECTVCGKKFKEKSHLATHSRAHVDTRNFKCNECGSLFKTKTNLFFHVKTHEEAPFICEKCNKDFATRKMLTRHIRVVHSGEGSYNCDQCGRSFKNAHNLEMHYTLHTGNKPFTCKVCGKTFVYKSTHTTHMKAHEADDQFNCELCPNDISDKAELRRRCSHHSEARPWLCTVCGKGYPLKSTLKQHMKTHEPDKPFKCNECGKSFMKKSTYECHMKSHSGENPPYMCDQCSQSYYNVFALKRHYVKHTGERTFVCDICNKSFWMKDALKVHKRSHENIKTFQCTLCSKAFVHKHTLVAHVRTHSGEPQFPCTLCPKTFSHKYNLDRHQRLHAVPTLSPPALPPSFMMIGPPKHLELPTLHIL